MTTHKISQLLPPTIARADSSNTCVNCEATTSAILCDDCHNKESQRDREWRREERRQKNKRRFEALKERGLLDDDFREAGFHQSDPKIEALNPKSWKRAREICSDNMYVFGPVGTGKTFLAESLLMRAFLQGRTVGIVTARRFTKASDRFDEGGDLMKAWCDVGVLLADDVDKAVWNAERLAALWELMNIRAKAKRRTIMTANLTSEKLLEMLSNAAANNQSLAKAALDRLKVGGVTKINLNGGSLR